jgi:two-component system, chemotaxis family, sensor kinase CheA
MATGQNEPGLRLASRKGLAMDACRLKSAVENLAAAVIVVEVDDRAGLAGLARLLAPIDGLLSQPDLPETAVESAQDLLCVVRDFVEHPEVDALSRLTEAIDSLQKEIHRCHKQRGEDPCGLEIAFEEVGAEGAPQIPAGQPVVVGKVRDPDTIALIGEFLSESEESLGRADQILMTVERDGATAESINGLFRVFHTIKGVAGFLELFDIQSLAHTTESLLNGCREGLYALVGERLDLVFDATAMMRKILGDLRVAVESSREFFTHENVAGLVARLKQALEVAADGGAKKAAQRETTDPRPEDVAIPGPEPPPVEVRSEPAAQVAAGAAPADAGGESKIRPTIKIDLERVDRLVEMIGELVVVEAMVVGAPEIAHSGSARVRNCLSQLAKVTRDLQDVGMRMRMLPVAGVFQKMARMARDVGRKAGKQIRVVLSGEQTEMDRSMVEQISDPLVHMIRNSVDHGIEPPELRRKLGKPEEGIVRLSACHEGGSVVIEISDDGRGLSHEAIVKKATAQGLIKPGDVLSEDEINSLIFAPGFSTAEKVTDISGRGVGMDVVRRNIDAMRGRIAIDTVAGQGTTFRITLPLTLAIIDGMLVACGEERYILPTLSVVESMKPDASMLVTQGGTNEMLNMRGAILPLLRLDRLLNAKNGIQDPTQALVVIVEGAGRKVGLLVDEVIAQQQVVIKTMGEGIGEVRFISGAAILADGRVGLIVNVEEIASSALDKRHRDFTKDGGSAAA